ncbi:hypothetical protein ACFQO9_19655 [Chryseobacterium zhengzhouense]|uniref:Uncharacterized protein n=1 Tax=Chryseobacterium zhengzhouense TaxID=1636086 RepID=A0ABW2M4Y5_9FLAO
MEIIIRKSYLFWEGDGYKYGGFGQLIDKFSSVSEAESKVNELTIDFLRNKNPNIKDFIFSNNDYTKDIELLERISVFYLQEFQLDFKTESWLPSNATDEQVLKLSNLLPFPFYSFIRKTNDSFYINELNDSFWSNSEINAIKNSDWDFTNLCPGITGSIKQLYNDIEMAKKDGTKKLLSNIIRENNHHLFIKLNNLKDLQFVNEWHNAIGYYEEILPNNRLSEKTEQVIERIKIIVRIEDIFITKEISFEEAMLFEEII